MNKMVKLYFLFVFNSLFLFTSCSNNMQQVKNESGTIIEEFIVNKDGEKHGLYKSFDEDGNVIETATYKNGMLHGDRNFYFKNGKLELSEHYVENVITGPYLSYYINGQIELSFEYENGVVNGLLTKYYENGSIMEEVNMSENEENGPFKEYYENGQLKWKGEYLNGDNEFGLLVNYKEDGTIIKKMMCDSMAICRTIWTPERGDIILEPLNLKIINE